jgi:hypothetical protein
VIASSNTVASIVTWAGAATVIATAGATAADPRGSEDLLRALQRRSTTAVIRTPCPPAPLLPLLPLLPRRSEKGSASVA